MPFDRAPIFLRGSAFCCLRFWLDNFLAFPRNRLTTIYQHHGSESGLGDVLG